ncbi:Hypothetical_protein [Hexamita inflata]|uniref:Hypothetical_protein n=1 Tax=Hexamita inflata TaxID=28002 RepID=A0AA86PID8_9EUKA|nr:Hypothetical protein HINF_LOCUS25463 [Hexamita inflata]
MTLFPGLNLEQIRNNANTITRNSPTQPNAVINKKISQTNSISRKSQRRFCEEVRRVITLCDTFGQKGNVMIRQKGQPIQTQFILYTYILYIHFLILKLTCDNARYLVREEYCCFLIDHRLERKGNVIIREKV